VGFALELPAASSIDLGTGSGIMAGLLATAGVTSKGSDSRAEWGGAWQQTLASSSAHFALEQTDVLEVAGSYDLAVSNPPFFARGTGPLSPHPLRAAARTESTATLAQFIDAGLRVASRLCLVVPVEREEEVAGFGVARWVRVGRRRSLFELPGSGASPDVVAEDDARVLGWYASLRRDGRGS
jgi:tRNA1Val (adenine37-N6)-methyltransferase